MEAEKFRKKPVVIEAKQFATHGDGFDIALWAGGSVVVGPDRLEIHTLEGVMRADIGDWVIRGVKGEFYPCKPDIFEETYERA